MEDGFVLHDRSRLMHRPLSWATSEGASSVSASAMWETLDTDQEFVRRAQSPPTLPPPPPPPPPQPRVPYNDPAYLATQRQPQLAASLRQVGTECHIVHIPVSSDPPRHILRYVRPDQQAVFATGARLAQNSLVGPHVGPGSGAPLNFMISRMRGTLEKLDRLDSDDSGSDSSDEKIGAATGPRRSPDVDYRPFGSRYRSIPRRIA